MKTPMALLLCWACLVVAACGQVLKDTLSPEDWMVRQKRNVLIPSLMGKLRHVTEEKLMANAADPALDSYTRIVSALLLLREHESEDAHLAALKAFSLKMEPTSDKWGDGDIMNLLPNWPVAWAASYRPELMETIIKGAVDGVYDEHAMTMVLMHYQETGTNPRPLLIKLRIFGATYAKADRCDRLLKDLHDDVELKTQHTNLITNNIQEEAAWAQPLDATRGAFKPPPLVTVMEDLDTMLQSAEQTKPESQAQVQPPVKAAPNPEHPAPAAPSIQVQTPIGYELLWFASGFAVCGVLVLLTRARR